MSTATAQLLATLARIEAKVDAVDNFLDSEIAEIADAVQAHRTTIATRASQTSFTLAAGASADDDAYNNCVFIFEDQTTPGQKSFGYGGDYTGSTRAVTLAADPGVFNHAVGDHVTILPKNALLVAVHTLLVAMDAKLDTIITQTAP